MTSYTDFAKFNSADDAISNFYKNPSAENQVGVEFIVPTQYFQVLSEKENNWAEAKIIIDPYVKAVNHEDNAGIILDEKGLTPTLD